MTPLPVLVSCDRLRARLTTAACVARYCGSDDLDARPECAGCPQGAARAPATQAVARMTRAEAIAAVVAGRLGINDAARGAGVSHTMMGRWARRAGVPRAPSGTQRHPHHDKALALVRSGRTQAEAAAAVGVAPRTVKAWVAEARRAT